MKNGSLYYGKDEIKVTENALNYKGMNFRYNQSQSFTQNYEAFLARLNGTDTYSKFSLFINSAHAVNKKNASVGTAAAATAIALSALFIFGSEIVGAVSAVVGLVSF